MSQQDGDRICFLLKECGGNVYQQARLNTGIYALSRGCIDDIGLKKSLVTILMD